MLLSHILKLRRKFNNTIVVQWYYDSNTIVCLYKEINIMGDMQKKKISTAEKIEARAQRKAETVNIDNTTIENLSKGATAKDKIVTLRTSSSIYVQFKKICQARGFSVNAALNMLVSDFIKDNKEYLDD